MTLRNYKTLCPLFCVFLFSSPITGQAVPRWSLVESTVIGDLDRRDYALSRVEGLANGDSGHVFVLQHTESAVKEYDGKGRFVRRIGRPGVGPGEFTTPVRVWWQTPELVVMDDGSSRISRFAKDGRFLNSMQLRPMGGAVALPIAVWPDGAFVGYERRLASDFQAGRTRTPLMAMRADKADTLAALNLAGLVTSLVVNQGNRMFVQRNLFSDHDLVAAQSDRKRVIIMNRKVNRSGVLTLTWIGLGGDTLAHRTLPLEPITVLKSVKDSVLGYFAERAVQMGAVKTAAAGREYVSKQLPIPAVWPLATDMIVAADGNVWIRRAPRGAVVDWVVLDPDGRRIADVTVPGTLRVFSITSTQVWGVRTDAMEVPYVVSYKIVKGRP